MYKATRLSTAILVSVSLLAAGANGEPEGAQAQARAVGMGHSFTAVADGIHALNWNPANLAAFDGPMIQIPLGFSLGMDIRNNTWSIDTWNSAVKDTAGRKIITLEGWRSLLGELGDGTWEGLTTITMQHVPTMVLGNFGLSMSMLVAMEVAVPRDVFGLVVDDVAVGEARSLEGLTANMWVAEVIGISHGRQVRIDPLYDLGLDQVSLGATIKTYLGASYMGLSETTGTFTAINAPSAGFDVDTHATMRLSGATWDSENDELEFNPGVGGWGMGLDLGIAGVYQDIYNVSAVLRNVPIRSLTFDTDEVHHFDLINPTSPPLMDILDSDDKPFREHADSLFHPSGQTGVHSKEEGGSFLPYAIPLALEIGVSRNLLLNQLTVAADYEQGFSDTPFSSTTPRLSAGAEFRLIGVFHFRGGMSVGGRTGHYSSLGFGLRVPVFYLDFGLLKRGGLVPLDVPFGSSADGYGLAFEMGLRF